MSIYSFSVFAFGISALFSGVLVFFDRQDYVGKLFLLYSFTLFGWAMGASIMLNDAISYHYALFAIRMGDGFIFYIPSLWVCLVSALTKRLSSKQKILIRGSFLFCLTGTFFIFSELCIPKLQPMMEFKHYKVAGALYHIFTLLFAVLVPYGFYLLIQHIRLIKRQGRGGAALTGFCIFSLIGYFAGALCILPAYGIACPQYALLLMPLYPFGLGYFIIRHRLFVAEDFAQAAHKDKLAALGILTASINHEIRGPLFMLRGTIETETSPETKTKLLSQINRVTDIVSRLTHFAKKGVDEAAKMETLDLKEVLTDIRPLFQHQLNYQHIEYVQDIPADLPKVMADRRYLEEILFNLILNACQALRETKNPKIELSAERGQIPMRDRERGRSPVISNSQGFSRQSSVVSPSAMTIVIADNGPGISPEQAKHIFKPFHTTKSEGTGLGLYITKQLVEKCGGKIDIQSEIGSGAKFIIRLKAELFEK